MRVEMAWVPVRTSRSPCSTATAVVTHWHLWLAGRCRLMCNRNCSLSTLPCHRVARLPQRQHPRPQLAMRIAFFVSVKLRLAAENSIPLHMTAKTARAVSATVVQEIPAKSVDVSKIRMNVSKKSAPCYKKVSLSDYTPHNA